MILADLVAGESVFVDANTLTYQFQPHPVWGPACSQLLQRIENQELEGYTSTHVLGELAHRMMTIFPSWEAMLQEAATEWIRSRLLR
jgi:hypothetical protein